jgi:hypothetical protein
MRMPEPPRQLLLRIVSRAPKKMSEAASTHHEVDPPKNPHLQFFSTWKGAIHTRPLSDCRSRILSLWSLFHALSLQRQGCPMQHFDQASAPIRLKLAAA